MQYQPRRMDQRYSAWIGQRTWPGTLNRGGYADCRKFRGTSSLNSHNNEPAANFFSDFYRLALYPSGASGNVTVSATGSIITASIGSVSISGDGNVTASGSTITASIGAVTVTGDANLTLTGNLGTFSIGSVSVAAGAGVSLSGNSATFSIGTTSMTGSAQVNPSGSVGHFTVGSIVFPGGTPTIIYIPDFRRRRR